MYAKYSSGDTTMGERTLNDVRSTHAWRADSWVADHRYGYIHVHRWKVLRASWVITKTLRPFCPKGGRLGWGVGVGVGVGVLWKNSTPTRCSTLITTHTFDEEPGFQWVTLGRCPCRQPTILPRKYPQTGPFHRVRGKIFGVMFLKMSSSCHDRSVYYKEGGVGGVRQVYVLGARY